MEANPEKEQNVFCSVRRVEADLEKKQNVSCSVRRVKADPEKEKTIFAPGEGWYRSGEGAKRFLPR